jgi:hypothetical protein
LFIIKYFKHHPIHDANYYCQLNKTESFFSQLTTQSYLNNTNTTYSEKNNFKKNVATCPNYHYDKYAETPQPNLAFISMSLLIGTCALALLLKKLRRSKFFKSSVRRTLSDVGILISIILMVFVNYIIEQQTDVKTEV